MSAADEEHDRPLGATDADVAAAGESELEEQRRSSGRPGDEWRPE